MNAVSALPTPFNDARFADAVARLGTLPLHVVKGQPALTNPADQVAALLANVQSALAGKDRYVLHVTSTYAGEGAGKLALDLAIAAARYSGRRTLLINLNTVLDAVPASVASIEGFFEGEADVSPLYVLGESNLCYAQFMSPQRQQALVKVSGMMQAMLDYFRSQFDQIILASEDGLGSAAVISTAAQADGVLLVVQAERTRLPVIQRFEEKLRLSQARLVGTVLCDRPFYIPEAVYRFFFRR